MSKTGKGVTTPVVVHLCAALFCSLTMYKLNVSILLSAMTTQCKMCL